MVDVNRAIVQPIVRDIVGGVVRVSSAWSPLSLSGLVAWYDPYDLDTMFTDIAGTTNVTASGDPVGKMLDKSGNGNHLVASLDARRPIYTVSGDYSFLDFDGTDDCLFSAAAIDMTATNTLSVCVGVTVDTPHTGLFFELSSSIASNNGSWYIGYATNKYDFRARGTVAQSALSGTILAPATNTVIGKATIGTPMDITTDGITVTTATSTGTGNFGNYVLYMGARANVSTRFNGKNYQSFITNTILTASEIVQAQAYIDERRP